MDIFIIKIYRNVKNSRMSDILKKKSLVSESTLNEFNV